MACLKNVGKRNKLKFTWKYSDTLGLEPNTVNVVNILEYVYFYSSKSWKKSLCKLDYVVFASVFYKFKC